jgi:hypothetical protein
VAAMFFEPEKGRKGLFHNKLLKKDQTTAPVKNQWPPKTLKHTLDKFGWRILVYSLLLFMVFIIIIFIFHKHENVLIIFALLAFTSLTSISWMIFEISPKNLAIVIPVIFGIVCFIIAFRILSFKQLFTFVYGKSEQYVNKEFSLTGQAIPDSSLNAKIDSIIIKKIDSIHAVQKNDSLLKK